MSIPNLIPHKTLYISGYIYSYYAFVFIFEFPEHISKHILQFHHYFFTLAPDDKYIRYTMEKAMYLVDETGLAQYNTLKEKGFYSNILGTSAVFSIFCDSIRFDAAKMEFTYYGRQRIERRSNILMRELVTAGQLKRVPRTENNPHGLLIVNWRTLLNRDIEQKTKNNY